MKRMVACCLVAFLVCSLAFAAPVYVEFGAASTEVTSIISSDTTWTRAGSPYELHGPVAILYDVTLTVQQGVTINMHGNYLQVNGTLIAKGTLTDKILFNNGYIAFTELSHGWDEQTKSGSIIENADFVGSYEDHPRYSAQITTEGASPKLTGLSLSSLMITKGGGSQTITNNYVGSMWVTGSQAISNNTIRTARFSGSQNIFNNYIDILKTDGSQVISGNVIKDLRIEGTPTVYNNEIGNNVPELITTTASLTMSGNATISSNIIYDGISAGAGSPIIWNNTITYTPSGYDQQNQAALNLSPQCNAIVSNNRITGMSASIPDYESLGMRPDRGPYYTYYGITCNNNQNIINNEISGCTKASILVYGNATIQKNIFHDKGVILDASNAQINFNNFEDDSGLYLWEHAQGNIDAANNWWGTTDTAKIDQVIYDFTDDFNLATVNYQPILNAPNSQAGLDLTTPMPTPVPTATSTPTNPPQTPTVTTGESSSHLFGSLISLDLEQTAIIALVVVVAALVVVVVVLLRTRRV
ncbi:MAG: right-handed parallel beta-helix repeat-containing protein [Candidatus Bathyarchaeota archaeon]|nr:right-handed parallel beta-helix repeat-containing protein [Candidatus Bathyarchaeota archaeon]